MNTDIFSNKGAPFVTFYIFSHIREDLCYITDIKFDKHQVLDTVIQRILDFMVL